MPLIQCYKCLAVITHKADSYAFCPNCKTLFRNTNTKCQK